MRLFLLRLAVFRSWLRYWLRRLTHRGKPSRTEAEWADPVGDVQRYIAAVAAVLQRPDGVSSWPSPEPGSNYLSVEEAREMAEADAERFIK